MKRIFITLFLVFLAIQSFSQEIPIDIITRVNSMDYIFEGEVIDKQSYWNTNHTNIFTTNLIQITKVLKGNLNCGTVEVITEGGEVNGTRIYSEHLLNVDIEGKGIFLCKLNTKELPATPFFNPTNTDALDGAYENQSYIKYTEENNQIIAHDIAGNYDSLIQLYNLAQIITGFNFIDCGNSNSLFDPPIKYNSDIEPYVPDVLPIYSASDFQNLKIEFKNKLLHSKKKKKRAGATINFSLANITITGTNPKYAEFDVMVTDNQFTKYLGIANVRLVYPTNVFGSYAVANNKIQVTRGALISSIADYVDPLIQDESYNAVYMIGGSKAGATNRAQVTNIPQQLFHIKMEVHNCIIAEPILIKDTMYLPPYTEMWGSAYFDAANSNDTLITDYDSLTIGNGLSMPACGITITDFWPKKLHAGVGDTLFVQGYQFRDSMGNGGLYFNEANTFNSGLIYKTKKTDIISWTDSLIKLKIPSVDSNTNNLTLGSGIFKVINNIGQSFTTPNELIVLYSLRNRVDSSLGTKNNVLHYNMNDSGGYDFFVDTSVSSKPLMFAALKKAMREWVCATGMNFRILRDTTGLPNAKQSDGINHITIGNLSNFGAAVIVTDDGGCLGSSPDIHLFTDIDLIISDSISNWHFDTLGAKPVGFNDFYYAMLHEIGHALGHKHVIDSTKLMHFVTPYSSSINVPYALRNIDLITNIDAVKGGQRQAGMSSHPPNFTACGPGFQMAKLPVCAKYATLSITHLNSNQENFKAYPNPFHDKILLQIFDKEITINKVELIDVSGKIAYSWNKSFTTIDDKITLTITNVSFNSMYFLVLHTNKGLIYKKMIHE